MSEKYVTNWSKRIVLFVGLFLVYAMLLGIHAQIKEDVSKQIFIELNQNHEISEFTKNRAKNIGRFKLITNILFASVFFAIFIGTRKRVDNSPVSLNTKTG